MCQAVVVSSRVGRVPTLLHALGETLQLLALQRDPNKDVAQVQEYSDRISISGSSGIWWDFRNLVNLVSVGVYGCMGDRPGRKVRIQACDEYVGPE